MIKYILLLVNGCWLFLFGLRNPDPPVISAQLPDTVFAGQTIEGQFKIKRSGLTGFGRIEWKTAPGILVTEADSKGSAFAVEGDVASWTWNELPEDEDIVISFKIGATEAAAGKLNSMIEFLYVEENEKKSIRAAVPEIAVMAKDLESAREPESIPEVMRDCRKSTDEKQVTVNIFIRKGNTKGFGRYSDDLPQGFQARPVQTAGASFSTADHKIRFVWVNIPDRKEIEISYILTSATDAEIEVKGEYAYVEKNESRTLDMQKEKFTLKGSSVAEQLKHKTKEPAAPSIPAPQPVASGKKKKAAKELPAESKMPEVGYRVQIGAYAKLKFKPEDLQKRFKIEDKVVSQMESGLLKFMVGTHAEYKEARDHRERLRSGNGVEQAFVAAYHEGKRITVQEALMITKQKWYK